MSEQNLKLLRIAGALGVIGVIVYFTPIIDLLEAFFWLVGVPLALLLAVGALSVDTYGLFMESKEKFVEKLHEAREKAVDIAEEMAEN